jgi:hypothetical protein
MKNIKHYKSIVVSLALVLGLFISGVAQAAGAPTVNTVPAQNPTATSAILRAAVWPNGADTQVWFKYSTNSNLANAVGPVGTQTVPASVTNQTVSFTASGLTPNTTYYFRAYAANQYGPATQGQIYSFVTTSGGGTGGTGGGSTCVINAFNVPATATLGQNVTLSWDTSNCTTVTLSGGGFSNAAQNVDGQVTVSPSAVGTYTFTLKANGTITAVRTLTVSGNNTGNCVINNFKLNGFNSSISLNYQSGMQVLLSWQTTGCSGVTISGGNLSGGTQAADGQIFVAPSAPGNYTFTLTAQGGSNPTATRVLTLNGGGGSGTGTTGNSGNCTIDSFTAYSTQVNQGGNTNLGWGTTNCNNVSISGIGSVSLDGVTSTGALYSTTTFTLTASGNGGTVTSSRTVNVTAQQQHCDITNFSASSSNISQGDSVTLFWGSNNCTSVSISGGGISGSYQASGSATINPSQTATYTITGYGPGGWNDTASVTVYVNQYQQPQNNCQINFFTANSNQISSGGNTTLMWGTSNCTSAYVSGPGVWSGNTNGSVTTQALYATATYTLTAYGTGGSQTSSVVVSVNGQQSNNQSCIITNLSANPSSVIRGGNTTLSWSTTGNCVSAILTNMSGYSSNVPLTGSSNSGVMNILGTRIFTLKVYDAVTGLSDTKTVSVLVYQNGTAQTTFACSDGYDNDGDGRIDGNDPGCTSSTDNNEFNTTTVTTNTTGSVNGITISTNTAEDYSAFRNRSNVAGLALFSGLTLPGTLVGWLILIIILTLIVLLLRSIIGYAPVHETL